MNLFFGHFVEVLQTLTDKRVKVDAVFVENKKSNQEVVGFCKKKKLRCHVVATYSDIAEVLPRRNKIDLIFCASFGIILKNPLIRQAQYIVNYHCADIERFRGRHPLPTAILHGAPSMSLSAHFIDSEKIDAGPFVEKVTLPINYEEDYPYNEKRLRYFLRPITESILEEYRKTKHISSWPVQTGLKNNYYKPLDAETLKKIFSVKKVKQAVK